MVYELYKLEEGTINEKLDLTIDEVTWSYSPSGSWKPHYNVNFKEKLIKDYEG